MIIAIIGLLFIPQTGMPIKVFISRLISFSPSEISIEKRETLDTYDWQLETLEGEKVNLSSSEGKVMLINFWATWCPPCVEEIPMLNRLSEKMQDTNFELLSVNFGQEKPTISEFLKKVNVVFPVLLDDGGKTAGNWNAIVLPSTFVIGPDGKFAYAVNAAIEWDGPEVVKALKNLVDKSTENKSNNN